MFSPVIISERMTGMLANYDFITRETLSYFDKRPPQAQRDADYKVAIEKCDALAGPAKDACIGNAKARYGKN